MKNKLILSIYFGEHDSCITFANNKKILLHLEAERYFRKKHIRTTYNEMLELISVGLDYLGRNIYDVETVLLAVYGNLFEYMDLDILGKKFDPIITSHHTNHIGTVLPANLNDALILCIDGGSEDGLGKFYLKKEEEIKLVHTITNPILNGRFYGTITQIIIDPDFYNAHQQYPGKTMGLAAFGNYSNEYANLIYEHREHIPLLFYDTIERLNKIFGISDNYKDVWLDQKRKDLAFTAQKIWIDGFLEEIGKYKDVSDNLYISGGCGLNVTLNSELAKTGWFKKIYVSPVSGDDGQSLGALLYRYPKIHCDYPFLGRGFGEIKEDKNLIKHVVKDLLEHKIIAWYQGRSEIGARALGHRSFLGLPDSVEMRVKLSEKIKGREPYRPVSAIMTEEFLPKFTDEVTKSPFMTFAPKVKEKIKKDIPAVVHLDGTCRIQTLKKSDNKVLYKILKEIGKKTGYPILMNSSFNIAGEPIVDTPEDAMQTFKKSKTEVLYLNGKRYEN